MKSRAILSHSCSTVREGVFTLVAITLTVAGLMAIFHVVFRLVGEAEPWYYVVHGIGLAIWASAVFCYALPNLFIRKRFEFTVFEDRIECRSPAAAYGRSFSVLIADVVALEEETGYEGANSWYLITRDNQRLQITPNYRNPVRRIVAALRELRPGIEVRQT